MTPAMESSSPVGIECSRCGGSVPIADAVQNYGALCSVCESVIWVTLFPAAFEAVQPVDAQPVIEDAEASCFYHATKRATVHCDVCGRFLCPLCHLELGGENLCPSCVEAGQRKKTLTRLENRRILYDTIALVAAIIPALLFWPMILGAPAALFVTIRYWKSPGSLLPRTRIRFYLAILLAILEILFIIALVVLIIVSWRAGIIPPATRSVVVK